MLRVVNLTFGFHQRVLFRRLSFDLHPGAFVQVRGANGVGKSCLLRTVCGLMPALDGALSWEVIGKKWHSDLEFLSAEKNGLFTKWSAQENLRHWQRLRGCSTSFDEVSKILDSWELKRSWVQQHLKVFKFSTGMKRRLALARVQLSGAWLWVLDEPSFGLDDLGVGRLQRAIGDHLAEGGAVLFVSHEKLTVNGARPIVLNLDTAS